LNPTSNTNNEHTSISTNRHSLLRKPIGTQPIATKLTKLPKKTKYIVSKIKKSYLSCLSVLSVFSASGLPTILHKVTHS